MNELTVAFLGDLYVAHDAALPEVDEKVVELLSSCDHVVANLEGPITSSKTHIKKTWPMLRQSPAVLDLLQMMSVDVVGFANNHVGDFGRRGLEDTLQVLHARGFRFGGAGLSSGEVYRPVRIGAGETRCSLLFAGEYHFGCACDKRHDGAGYAWLFSPLFTEMLKREASECDFVVVVAHAGVERIDHPLTQWREAYKKLIDSGAGAVVAHHPHSTQGCEVYNGAPIFYSIGNLFFNSSSRQREWTRSQIPLLTFDRNGAVSWRIEHARFDFGSGGGEVLYDDSAETARRFEQLCADFSDPEYERLVVEELKRVWERAYSTSLSPCVKTVPSIRFLRSAVRRAGESVLRRRNALSRPFLVEMFVECESHRWALAEIMRSMYDDRWDSE